jgi:hypothetical protein
MRVNLAHKCFSPFEFCGGGIALAIVASIAVGSSYIARPQISLPAKPLHYATAFIEQSEAVAKLSLQQPSGLTDDDGETHNVHSSDPPSDTATTKPDESDATAAPPPALDRSAHVTRSWSVEPGTEDATGIPQNMIEAGSLGGFTDAIWGPPSLDLPRDSRFADSPQRNMPNSLGAPAVSTFVGGWTDDIGRCQTGRNTPLVISSRAAKTARGECDFGFVVRETVNQWRVAAICTTAGEFWRAHIALKLVEPNLTWSSERGTTTYVRCKR